MKFFEKKYIIADNRDGYLTKKIETPFLFQLEYFSVCRDLWIDLILAGRGGQILQGFEIGSITETYAIYVSITVIHLI